jgi:hypothetical protein
MRPDEGTSPLASYGPLLEITNMSRPRTLPSLEKPTFILPMRLGRARPMNVSSSRLMRIITGALTFFERSAGMVSVTPAVTLLPNPPPVYSLIKTTLLGSMFNHLAIAGTVCEVLCVPV